MSGYQSRPVPAGSFSERPSWASRIRQGSSKATSAPFHDWKGTLMQKTLRSAAVVAAAAVVLAGCSSSTAPAAQRPTLAPQSSPTADPSAQMAGHNVEEPMADVPWSEVGPGWML